VRRRHRSEWQRLGHEPLHDLLQEVHCWAADVAFPAGGRAAACVMPPDPYRLARHVANAIPEGALVDSARTNDRYAESLWGETSAWVQTSDLQVLPKR